MKNNRTATLKTIMRMTFIMLLLMPLGEWKNNGNDGEGNVQQQQYAITAQTMCKYHFHVHRPPRHVHRSSRSRNHNENSKAKSDNTSLSIKQRIKTWYKEIKRKYTNDNNTVVTNGRQTKFNRQLKLQQGRNKIYNPTREDIRRGFYIKNPNTTAWKPMSTWNINNTSTAWTTITNTWLKLLVLNALCNNAQTMQHYRHDGTTMTWDTDTTNTATRKQ